MRISNLEKTDALLSRLAKRHAEQNQPITLRDIYLIPDSILERGDRLGEEIKGSPDSEYCSENDFNRLTEHIFNLAETMKGHFHPEDHEITRLCTPEFSFFSKHPLSTDQFHTLVEKLTKKLEGYPNNLHFLFSTFAVSNGSEVMNTALHIECGDTLQCHTFIKSNPLETDLSYNKQQITNTPGAMIPSSGTDKDITSTSTQSVFEAGVDKAKFLQCTEICFDHAEKTGIKQMTTLFTAQDSVYYPSQVNQVVSSSTIFPDEQNYVSNSVSHIDTHQSRKIKGKEIFSNKNTESFGGAYTLRELPKQELGYFNPKLEALRRNHNRKSIEEQYEIVISDDFLHEKITSAVEKSDWDRVNFLLEIAPNTLLRTLLIDESKISDDHLNSCNKNYISLVKEWENLIPEKKSEEDPINRLLNLLAKPSSTTPEQRIYELKSVESIMSMDLMAKLYGHGLHVDENERKILLNMITSKISEVNIEQFDQFLALNCFSIDDKNILWDLCKDKFENLEPRQLVKLINQVSSDDSKLTEIWNSIQNRLDKLIGSFDDFAELYSCSSFNDSQREQILKSIESKVGEWCKDPEIEKALREEGLLPKDVEKPSVEEVKPDTFKLSDLKSQTFLFKEPPKSSAPDPALSDDHHNTLGNK